MNYNAKSIRTFIGAKNYKESIEFYSRLEFEVIFLDPKMSLVKVDDDHCFYLQDYYAKTWVDNSMVFLEVNDLDSCFRGVKEKNLVQEFKQVKLSKIISRDWGREFFLHDPSGVLWHFGSFQNTA